MATFNELVTAWGFEVDPKAFKNIENIQKGLSQIGDVFQQVGKKFVGDSGLKSFFLSTTGTAQELTNLSKTLGISTEKLQEWSYAAKASGVSSDAVMSDIRALRVQFRMGEKDVLRLADKLKTMSTGDSYFYGQMHGISTDMVNMLRQGSAELKKLFEQGHKNGAIIPEEEIRKGEEANKKIQQIRAQFEGLTQTIVLKAAPAVSNLIQKFQEWLSANPERIEYVINGITAAIIAMGASSVAGAINKVIGLFLTLGTGIGNTFTGIDKLIKQAPAFNNAVGGMAGAASSLSSAIGFVGKGVAAWELGKFAGEKIAEGVIALKDKFSREEGKTHLLTPEEAKAAWERYNAAKSMPVPEQMPSAFTQAANASQTASGTTMNGTTINIITSQPVSQVMDEIGNAVGGGPDAQPFTLGIVS